jgi:hypothetical protein
VSSPLTILLFLPAPLTSHPSLVSSPLVFSAAPSSRGNGARMLAPASAITPADERRNGKTRLHTVAHTASSTLEDCNAASHVSAEAPQVFSERYLSSSRSYKSMHETFYILALTARIPGKGGWLATWLYFACAAVPWHPLQSQRAVSHRSPQTTQNCNAKSNRKNSLQQLAQTDLSSAQCCLLASIMPTSVRHSSSWSS